jgi:hypothetical protein
MLGNLYQKMVKYLHTKGQFTESAFLNSLKKEEKEKFHLLALTAEASFEEFDEEKRAEEIYFSVKRIKKLSINKKKQALAEKIAGFERVKKKVESRKALEELQALLEEEKLIS